MHRRMLPTGVAGLALLAGAPGAMAADQVLNVITAGSENMVDYVTDYLAPKFNAMHPDVEVRVTGTGPGDAGSQKIYEKLGAQQAAGTATADVDVAVVHQKMAGQMVEEGLLAKYRDDIETGKLVSRDTAKNALGADVEGYVMPMFHSQTAIAWNPALISEPPHSYAELATWVEEHPGQFGYNGIREGMSGVAFVVGWLYSNTDGAEQLLTGPYDPALKETWSDALGQPQGVQPAHHLHAEQRRHARHAEPRRDRARPGVGRHVLHLAGRRPPRARRQARADRARHAGPADVLRDARERGPARARARLHRARDQPRGPGGRHRQAVQLVPRASTPSTSRRRSTRRPGTSCSPTSAPRTSRPRASPSRSAPTSTTSSRPTSGRSRTEARRSSPAAEPERRSAPPRGTCAR